MRRSGDSVETGAGMVGGWRDLDRELWRLFVDFGLSVRNQSGADSWAGTE